MLNFLCIGAQKAGTTWLYEHLSRHPEVAFPGGKEVHYWNARRDELPLAWYLDLFADDHLVNGDITPAYATLEEAVVEEIARAVPHAKVMFILRNPIERAWSAAMMALSRAEMAPDEASDAWFSDHFRSRGSRLRGDYERTIRIWSAHFQTESAFRVFFHDDLIDDPSAFLSNVLRFLDVTPTRAADEYTLRDRVFAGPGLALRPSLRAALVDLYGDQIKSLSKIVQRDLDHWIEP